MHTFNPSSIVFPMLAYTVPYRAVKWHKSLPEESWVFRQIKYVENLLGVYLEGFIYTLKEDRENLYRDKVIWYKFLLVDLYQPFTIYEDRAKHCHRIAKKHTNFVCPIVNVKSHLEVYQLHETYRKIESPDSPTLVLSHPYAYYPRQARAHTLNNYLEVGHFIQREAFVASIEPHYIAIEDSYYGRLDAKLATKETILEGDTVRYFGYPHQTKPREVHILSKIDLQETITELR